MNITRPIFTIFPADIYDTRGRRVDFGTWDRLETAIMRQPRHDADTVGRWAACLFAANARCQAGFRTAVAASFDLENKAGTVDVDAIKRFPWLAYWHTTSSDTPRSRRLRGIVPFSSTVDALDDYFGLIEEWRPEVPEHEHLDRAIINPAQPYKMPCRPRVGEYEAFVTRGPVFDPLPYVSEARAKRKARAAELARRASQPVTGNRYERACAYIDQVEGAISGAGGSHRTFHVACVLVKRFQLPDDVALRIMMERYNVRCVPAWSEKELRRKIRDAHRARNYMPIEDRPRRTA